ncbi:MAG: response regulator transcription factor [Chitinophagaceae bacterium]|nr:response regulator transcription factor [Chitinophagaceae bacterium]MBK9569254.1 response regulator transcription factor [Chitinophagaceae bacterium]MBL0273543.1 response regulator transcription factor [Chitinophagaceae bacterium]
MIRILIADDHAIVRRGLKQILEEHYSTSQIGEAGDAEDLIKKVMDQDWDVVICDMSMPGRSGLDALGQIKQFSPKLPVLIMSMYPEDQYALRVLKAGASGFLGKETIHDDIVKAIETVRSGRKFITPAIAEKLADAFETGASHLMHESLSDREFDVFKLLSSGKSITEISEHLSLSATTVSTYRSRIMYKMNMHSNADLTRYALEKGLI